MKQKSKSFVHIPGLSAFFILTCLSLFSSGCNDDDGKAPAHPLIGTWYLSAFLQTGCTEPENNESYTLPCTPTSCYELKIFSDQTYQVTSIFPDESAEIVTGTYKIQGNNLEICEDNLYCSNGDFEMLPGNNSFTLTETDGASGCVALSTFIRK